MIDVGLLRSFGLAMQEFQEDYYAVLGVDEKSSPDDIRKAYLKLAKKLHPDRFPNDPEKKAAAQQEFAKVTRAHEVLGDAKQREEYDALRTLARTRAALDTGAPGEAAAVGAAAGAAGGAVSGQVSQEVRTETKEQWAAKHAQRAAECSQRKKYPEAETAIKEAIRLDPNKVKYHVQLAEVYLARGWKTLAMTEAQAALRLDPKDDDAKQFEQKLKSGQKAGAKADDKKGGSFLDQLSKLLGKK